MGACTIFAQSAGGLPRGAGGYMYQRWYQLLVSCSTNAGIITHTRPINCETPPRSRSAVKNRAHVRTRIRPSLSSYNIVVCRVCHTHAHVDTLYSCSRPQQMLTLHAFMKRRNEQVHPVCVVPSESQLLVKTKKTPSCSLCDI